MKIEVIEPVFDQLVYFGIFSIVFCVFIYIFYKQQDANRVKFLIVSAIVISLSLVLAKLNILSGFNTFPSPIFILMNTLMLLSILFSFSIIGNLDITKVSISTLVCLDSL